MSYDAMFTPIKIRGLELKNRVILPGMNTKMAIDKHQISDNLIAYHAARAKGGCGLNIFEPCAINPETHGTLYMGIYTDDHVKELKKVTDAIHENDGKAGIQIWHGGFVPKDFFDKTCKLQTPDTITVDEIHDIVNAFGSAAKRAVDAGFDVLEYHAAHTYIPHEFLNPGLNKRTDEYGGSFENRCRFSLEVIKAMRENMPEDMPLFMRHNAIDELMEKNIPAEEIIAFINLAADAGVDVADLSRGNACSFATVYEVPPFNLEPGFNMENIRKIKEGIKIPVCGVGRLVDPADANKYIEDGSVDMVAIGRAQLADPEWCNKAQAGKAEEIRRCIGCAQGCYDAIIDVKRPTITCTRNPMLCLEYKGIQKAETAKNIMVIGGGMAGLQTAEFLKKRGHNPSVYEASDKLGGQFHLAGVAPHKQEMDAAASWEGEEAKRLGIDIHMNTVVTPELIAEKKPDEVVIAIGSDYKAPAIEGVDGNHVYTQYQVLSGEVTPTGKVIVVGCGAVGSEVALHLAAKGAEVVCLEKKFSGNGLGMLRKMFMTPDFATANIKAVSKADVYKIEGNTVHYKLTSKKTKKILDKEREFDSIVICTGIKARSSEELQAKCEELGVPCHIIGDAKKATNALNAAADAYAIGTTI